MSRACDSGRVLEGTPNGSEGGLPAEKRTKQGGGVPPKMRKAQPSSLTGDRLTNRHIKKLSLTSPILRTEDLTMSPLIQDSPWT